MRGEGRGVGSMKSKPGEVFHIEGKLWDGEGVVGALRLDSEIPPRGEGHCVVVGTHYRKHSIS